MKQINNAAPKIIMKYVYCISMIVFSALLMVVGCRYLKIYYVDVPSSHAGLSYRLLFLYLLLTPIKYIGIHALKIRGFPELKRRTVSWLVIYAAILISFLPAIVK
jgi:hypothetical protein